MKHGTTFMTRLFMVIVVVLLTTAMTMTAWGQAYYKEDFNTTNWTVGDSLNGKNGWLVTATASFVNPVKVVSPGLTYSGYASSGIGNSVKVDTTGQDVNHTFTAQTSGSVYTSFMINVTKATTTGDYFLHLMPNPVNTAVFTGRVFVKNDGSGNLSFGLQFRSAGVVYTAASYALNTTYLLVLKHKITAGAANDTTYLFVNPTIGAAEPSPTLTHADASVADLANVGDVALRQGTAASAPRLSVDGIRVATYWDGVVGTIAAPTMTTNPATSVTSVASTLNGNANANNDSTTVTFDYGTSISYGSSIAGVPGSLTGSSATAVTAALSALTQNETYHFRIVGVSSTGTTNGLDQTFTTLPATPATLAATSTGETSFTANWAAGGGNAPATYDLDVATDAGFTSMVFGYPVTGIAATTYGVTGLSGGTTYYYRVRGVDVGGSSSNSNTTTVLTLPGAPTATAATGTGASAFTANWTAPGGIVTNYRLDVSTDIAFGSFVVGYSDKTVAGTSDAVTGLATATKFYYRVRAVNASGTSPNSNIDSGATVSASAPSLSDPTATAILTTTATLGATLDSYNNDPDTERGIVWSTSPNPTTADTKVIEGSTGVGIYTVSTTGLPPGTLVHYRGYAINGQGTGYTLDATFYTQSTEPSTHAGSFSATTTSSSTIALSWTAATGANGYIILRKIGSDPTGIPSDATEYTDNDPLGDGTVAAVIFSGATTTTEISGLTAGTTHHFSIMPFAWDGVQWPTINYKTDPTIPTSNATTFSKESDVIATPGFFFEQNIDYKLYTSVVNIDTANALPAFGVTVRDGGAGSDADAVGTELSSVSFAVTNPALMTRAALYHGGIELAEVPVTSSPITFSALGLTVADGASADLVLYVTFATSMTDNAQVSFAVSAVTADGAGSGFAAANGGGATSSVAGDDNRIEVTATALTFAPAVLNSTPNTNFTASAKAIDVNSNTDADYTSVVTFSKNSGPGTLSGTTGPSAVSGVATTTNLQFNAGGTYVLRAQSGVLTDALSNTFIISSPAVFYVAGPIIEPTAGGGLKTTDAVDTLHWRTPSTWVIASGGSILGYPGKNDQVILDNTYKSGSYTIKVGETAQDSVKQVTIGYSGNTNTISLLIPVVATPSLALTFGDNAPGNYDMIVDAGGVAQCDKPTGRFNILGFAALGDSLIIKPGGTFIHHSTGSLSGILIGLSKNLNLSGAGVLEVRLPRSPVPTGGVFHFTTAGFVGPTLKFTADSAGAFDNSTSAASAFGSAFILGDFVVGANVSYTSGTGGSYEGDLYVRGNIINNGTINFSSNTQNVLAMIGTSAQTISGNALTLGKGIFVGNSAGVTLLTNLNVTGGAVQTTGSIIYAQPEFPTNFFTVNAAGTLNTGALAIFLNPGGSMNEGANAVQGNVSATRTALQNVNQTFGSMGFEINALGGAPGVTTINRKTGVVSTGSGHNSILRYYDVTPTNNASLNATINVSYTVPELNGITEADLLLHKSTDGGLSWTGKSAPPPNPSFHRITATGVANMSRWTAASKNAPLFISHTITMRKLEDTDGNIFTAGDQTAKKWRLSLFRDSVTIDTAITGNPNSGVVTAANLEAGKYIAVETDSTGWLHLGKVHNGTPVVGGTRYDTLIVAGGIPGSVDFINQRVSALVVRKFLDTDGDANTIESPKKWHLSIYKGSISGGNLVAEADTNELTAANIQAGTYIVSEADSGASWVRFNGNQTRNDTIVVSANTTVIDTMINFQPNTIVVGKFEDNDGQFGTSGDRTPKGWYLEIRKNSSGGPVVASGSAATLNYNNAGDGTYYISEADSAGWIHLGQVVNGSPVSGSSNNRTVTVVGGQTATVNFVNAPPIYAQYFRSFRPDSIGLDKDNFGKIGKYVKRKADKVYFKFAVSSPARTQHLTLKLKLGMLSSGAITRGVVNIETLYVWSNVKEFTTSPLDTGLLFQVTGVGYKGSPVKVSFEWGTSPKVTKGTVTTFALNQPKLPMPNRVNALFETYEQGGFASTSGLAVGVARADSPKAYAWLVAPKYSDVLKTLKDKNGIQSLDNPKFFSYFDDTKPMKGLLKSIPPSKQNNGLLGNLVALKLNIAASALGKTPPGFGELIYNGTPTAAETTAQFFLQGRMIKDIAKIADTLISGYYFNSTHIGNFNKLTLVNETVKKLNAAFEGPMDTTDWAVKLHLKGTRTLLSVPYLMANPSIEPTTITPSQSPIAQEPVSYQLYQNYPNPFNPTTMISFDIPEQSFVTLKIYNMLGQEVTTLIDNQQLDEGTQELQFNASNLASGVYFYRIVAQGFDEDGISTNNFTMVKKMVLVK